jgi:hypothetical protein
VVTSGKSGVLASHYLQKPLAGASTVPADYASFFEDPDGNRLEICFLTKHQGLQGGS